MNVLRNWGGGIYQHEYFYQSCDEKGIMVWEEFMFACAMYPRDSSFLSTVQNEVQHQILRLMYHPSLIIWSGNNENELALGSGSSIGWYPETEINPYRYVVDYNYLNTDTLYRNLQKYEPVRPWLPSSPSNGILRLDPYVERWGNPASEYWGDVHYYNYVDLCTNTSIYPKPRFASEYGFQSYPNLLEFSQVSEPEDWSVFSDFLRHRQHHPRGNEQLDNQIKMLFQYPNNTNTDKQFSDWLYLTQCVQALCLRTESEHYRRQKGEPAGTMGALYWQLNSIWQAPTWSSLQYGNHWKLVHYYTKEFFADTIISSYQDYSTLDYFVHVTSDSLDDQTGSYSILAYRWIEGDQVMSWTGDATIPALSSLQVYSGNINDMLSSAAGSPNADEVFYILQWSVNSQVVAENWFYLSSFNSVVLPNVQFDVTVLELSGRTATLQLQSTAVAPFVFVESTLSGRFSSNGFLTLPNTPISLSFYGWEDFTLSELQKSLVVRSLRGTYQ
jgi:beta-mannosidase